MFFLAVYSKKKLNLSPALWLAGAGWLVLNSADESLYITSPGRESNPSLVSPKQKVVTTYTSASTIVSIANWLRNSRSFFVIHFCSLSLLFVGLDYAQNTKGIEIYMNN